jgi:hypothetical protein
MQIKRTFLTVGVAVFVAGSTAHADVFMLKLAAPHRTDDKKPYITIIVKKADGTETEIKTLIDSGSPSSLIISNDKATELGLTGGSDTTLRGVGGSTPAKKDVSLPADRNARVKDASTPTGQPATQPTLPDKVKTGELPNRGTAASPAKGEGTLGQEFLSQFGTYGVVKGKTNSFLKLIKTDQYDTAAKAKASEEKAIGIAFPTSSPALGPDGKPVGTQTAPVTPSPPKNLPPEEESVDDGYLLEMFLRNPLDGTTADEEFLIKSGVESTLISESLARALGVDVSGLPVSIIDVNFSLIEIPFANLQMSPFGLPELGSEIFQVGVLPDAFNPFNENLLGSDFLSQFAYWGIDTLRNEFYASATVPEANALWLVATAGIAVLLRRRQR